MTLLLAREHTTSFYAEALSVPVPCKTRIRLVPVPPGWKPPVRDQRGYRGGTLSFEVLLVVCHHQVAVALPQKAPFPLPQSVPVAVEPGPEQIFLSKANLLHAEFELDTRH